MRRRKRGVNCSGGGGGGEKMSIHEDFAGGSVKNSRRGLSNLLALSVRNNNCVKKYSNYVWP